MKPYLYKHAHRKYIHWQEQQKPVEKCSQDSDTLLEPRHVHAVILLLNTSTNLTPLWKASQPKYAFHNNVFKLTQWAWNINIQQLNPKCIGLVTLEIVLCSKQNTQFLKCLAVCTLPQPEILPLRWPQADWTEHSSQKSWAPRNTGQPGGR